MEIVTPIEAEYFYGKIIFKTEENYYFFLNKIKISLLPVCDIYAFCLLPNHFHLIVRIKEESELINLVKVLNLDKVSGINLDKVFAKQKNLC